MLFDFARYINEGVQGLRNQSFDAQQERLRRQANAADARRLRLLSQGASSAAEKELRTIELTKGFASDALALELEKARAGLANTIELNRATTADTIATTQAAGGVQRENLRTQGDILAGQLGLQRGHEKDITGMYIGNDPSNPFSQQFIQGARDMQASNQDFQLRLAQMLKPTTLQQLGPLLQGAGTLATLALV